MVKVRLLEQCLGLMMGSSVHFWVLISGVFTFQANLNRSLRDTAVRLAELGWLHNKIRKYADQRSLDRSFGLVGQVCSSLLGLKCLISLRFESGLLFRTVSLVTDGAVSQGLLRRCRLWELVNG